MYGPLPRSLSLSHHEVQRRFLAALGRREALLRSRRTADVHRQRRAQATGLHRPSRAPTLPHSSHSYPQSPSGIEETRSEAPSSTSQSIRQLPTSLASGCSISYREPPLRTIRSSQMDRPQSQVFTQQRQRPHHRSSLATSRQRSRTILTPSRSLLEARSSPSLERNIKVVHDHVDYVLD